MESEQPIHTEVTLLPAYVNHTLTQAEHQQVEHHLESCHTCRQELQEITTMQAALKTAIQQRPGPSPAALSTIMRRIHQEPDPDMSYNRDEKRNSWWESLEKIFRYPFELPWIPAFASVLIVGQTALLLVMLGGTEIRISLHQKPVMERGVPQGIPANSPIHIQIEFVETAQERQIRGVIGKLGGRVVDGPTPEGFYIVSFAQKETASTESIVSALHSHPDLIKTAKPLQS